MAVPKADSSLLVKLTTNLPSDIQLCLRDFALYGNPYA